MRRTGAYTLLELAVTTGLIAILTMLVSPVFRAVRGKALLSRCEANVRGLHHLYMQYVGDWDEHSPPPAVFGRDGLAWLKAYDVYNRRFSCYCPAARPLSRASTAGYAYNSLLVDPREPERPLAHNSIANYRDLVVFWCAGDGGVVGQAAGDGPDAPRCEPSWRCRHYGGVRPAAFYGGERRRLTDALLDKRSHPEHWVPQLTPEAMRESR